MSSEPVNCSHESTPSQSRAPSPLQSAPTTAAATSAATIGALAAPPMYPTQVRYQILMDSPARSLSAWWAYVRDGDTPIPLTEFPDEPNDPVPEGRASLRAWLENVLRYRDAALDTPPHRILDHFITRLPSQRNIPPPIPSRDQPLNTPPIPIFAGLSARDRLDIISFATWGLLSSLGSAPTPRSSNTAWMRRAESIMRNPGQLPAADQRYFLDPDRINYRFGIWALSLLLTDPVYREYAYHEPAVPSTEQPRRRSLPEITDNTIVIAPRMAMSQDMNVPRRPSSDLPIIREEQVPQTPANSPAPSRSSGQTSQEADEDLAPVSEPHQGPEPAETSVEPAVGDSSPESDQVSATIAVQTDEEWTTPDQQYLDTLRDLGPLPVVVPLEPPATVVEPTPVEPPPRVYRDAILEPPRFYHEDEVVESLVNEPDTTPPMHPGLVSETQYQTQEQVLEEHRQYIEERNRQQGIAPTSVPRDVRPIGEGQARLPSHWLPPRIPGPGEPEIGKEEEAPSEPSNPSSGYTAYEAGEWYARVQAGLTGEPEVQLPISRMSTPDTNVLHDWEEEITNSMAPGIMRESPIPGTNNTRITYQDHASDDLHTMIITNAELRYMCGEDHRDIRFPQGSFALKQQRRTLGDLIDRLRDFKNMIRNARGDGSTTITDSELLIFMMERFGHARVVDSTASKPPPTTNSENTESSESFLNIVIASHTSEAAGSDYEADSISESSCQRLFDAWHNLPNNTDDWLNPEEPYPPERVDVRTQAPEAQMNLGLTHVPVQSMMYCSCREHCAEHGYEGRQARSCRRHPSGSSGSSSSSDDSSDSSGHGDARGPSEESESRHSREEDETSELEYLDEPPLTEE
ncbi:hypothetical protein V5O48_017985 [Marasmius crinis-equi]|uniref:Uncharacterized protein n=1 Tax=Marasmius crinis-equi TaxID=585013 RepID=A0ABR3EMM4_9AGAR